MFLLIGKERSFTLRGVLWFDHPLKRDVLFWIFWFGIFIKLVLKGISYNPATLIFITALVLG